MTSVPAFPAPAAADTGPAAMLAAEALPVPPTYRSEGFAEDLLDADDEPAAPRPGRGAVGWLLAVPLTAAAIGALASTLAAAA
jgi:hypothetical protein